MSAGLALGVGLALDAGCADDGGFDGVDLRLVADPERNRITQVLAEVQEAELVLDAPGGLYPPGAEWTDGELSIEDADGDPSDLELVAELPLPAERYPRIRLLRGGLADAPLDVEIRGYDADGVLAARGTVSGFTLGADDVLEVPFNLLEERLPPRVSSVIAEPLSSCTPPRLTVVFSRAVDPASVLGPLAVTFEPGGAPRTLAIDALGRIATVTPPDSVAQAGRVRFSLRVAPIVTDPLGEPLDQFPSVAGLQGYEGLYDERCP